jgi:uncharacterized phage protein (TIGR01671 family)
MREIKFRAFVKDLKWVVVVTDIYFDTEEVEVDLTNGDGDTAIYRFDEIELVQYTGLKDKNGKDVYEGDIVKFSDNLTKIKDVIGEVGFENGSFVIKSRVMTHYRWIDYEAEVIGNVFNMPDWDIK